METTPKKHTNKFMKYLTRTLLTIVIALAVFLVSVFGYHRIALHNEAKKIVDYGQKFEVYDGTMNVRIEGSGPETIVLLTGYGTATPGLDFTPIINELKADHRVIVIEPFGYGLSSQTQRERTLDNMTDEIHEVIKQLDLDSFILGGHSIAGLYGLNYVNKYPQGVKGFAGIDTSSPFQPWPGFDDRLLKLAYDAGLIRFALSLSPTVLGDAYDAETAKQMNMLMMRNANNKTQRAELKELGTSFDTAKALTFPKELPVILFVASGSLTGIPNWYELHYDLIDGLDKGRVVELEGDHYLHHTQSPTIASEIRSFFAE